MKSLIRGAKHTLASAKRKDRIGLRTVDQPSEAQCCAKVSKTVAGCHD